MLDIYIILCYHIYKEVIKLEQKSFLEKIEDSIFDFSDLIFTIGIVNISCGEKEQECIDKSSSKWRIFVDNFNKYFDLYPNDDRKNEMQALVSQQIIDEKWVEDAKVFINKLKNDMIS